MKILITGISGGQGRILAKRLLRDARVAGADLRPWPSAPREIRIHPVDLRSKRFDKAFRVENPDAVVHMGFVRHFRSTPQLRHQVNIEGTKRLMENCAASGVKQLVVVSSHYVYGAFADNPRYMDEDHPLSASRSFPEIRDLVEVEGLVSTFLWQHPEVRSAVLRPVHTLGPGLDNAISRYLHLPVAPRIAGFNPMMQFMHGEDLADAIALTLQKELRGVFNVAGSGAVPLSIALRESGAHSVALPDSVAHLLTRRLFGLGFYRFPPGALDFIKFPCTISDQRFRAATGFEPAHCLEDTLRSSLR